MTSKKLPKGFKEPNKEIKPRHVISLVGPDKSGKTHYALTGMGPIAFFNLNNGLEGVVHKFDKEVYVFDLNLPEELGEAAMSRDDTAQKKKNKKAAIDMKNIALNEIERFEEGWRWALYDPDIKTIVIDKGGELWLLYRVAEFGKTTQVPSQLYNYLNAKFERRLNEIYNSNKNLIIVHGMKEIYKDKDPTGDYEREGYKNIGGIVQTNLSIIRKTEMSQHPIPGQPNPPFSVTINDSRLNPDVWGMEFTGLMCNFPSVAAIISQTGPDKWM